MPDPRRIYRLFLKLYPARFREEYERPLERQFWDDYQDARGLLAKTWLWLHSLADLALSIPLELFRELRQDVIFAFRIHRRRPFLTALAVIALALAIGAATGVFSVVNTLLLRSLPFRDPDGLVEMIQPPLNDFQNPAELPSLVARSPYLAAAAAWDLNDVNLVADSSLRIRLIETSPTFFEVLGVEPVIGRTFASDASNPGANNQDVVMLSYSLWQAMFAGNPSVLGSLIHLNGIPMTVIGVAPPAMDFPMHAAAWTPTFYDPAHRFTSAVRFGAYIGRLKPGVSVRRAAAIFRTEIRRNSFNARLSSLRDQLAGNVRQASLILLGAVGFVLLIACANIAHLMLSRVTERRQELEIRAAIGASRARLVQQLITESTLLTATATAAGIVVALWAARLASVVRQPTQLAAQEYTILDWRVAAFAIALAALTGLVFGVLPARLIGRPQSNAGLVRNRLRSVLVVMQAALTLVLIAGASTMGRSFLKFMGSDFGFHTAHVVTMNVALAGTPHRNSQRSYYTEALARLRQLPGVESAGAVDILPLTSEARFRGFGFQLDGTVDQKSAVFLSATPGYFATIGTPILEGREFNDQDRDAAIVSETFARQFPGIRLVGRTLTIPRQDPPYQVTVIGIVKDQYYAPGVNRDGFLFVPAARALPGSLTFVARVRGDTAAYGPICRDALQIVEPKAPIFNVKTLDQRLAEAFARPRFYTTVVLFFGAFALLLAVIGMYGVAAFSVAQRSHEIGVRLAIGASPRGLRGALLRQSLVPVIAGIVIGIWGALQLGRLVQTLFSSADPIATPASLLAGALLFATAAVAIWRATKQVVLVDPIRVLRAE